MAALICPLKVTDAFARVANMEHIDRALRSVLADWLINFSVFWFGLAIVGPIFPGVEIPSKLVILTVDIILGIVTLYLAYRIRKEIL